MPRPKRPKSPSARSCRGLVLPNLMACRSSWRLSPLPLSIIATLKESSIGIAKMEISRA